MGVADRFRAYAERPPPRSRVVLTLIAGPALTYGVGERRGVALGALAFLVYVVGFGWGLWRVAQGTASRWAAEHPVLDGLYFLPLMFLLLAYVTSVPLAICALITAGSTAALLIASALRRTRANA